MRCPACGQENLDTARTCKLCGNQLVPGYQYPYPPAPQVEDGKIERAIMWLVVVLIIVIVVSVVAGLLFWLLLLDELQDFDPWPSVAGLLRTATCF